MNWYFETDEQGVIQLRANMEAPGVVGHVFEEVRLGETFYGISYDALRIADAGILEVNEDGTASILE